VTEVFAPEYASAYDIIYEDKDYPGECDLLETIFRESPRPVTRVLDLGCGTGGHALELARRGYSVTGVDRSPAMLDLARTKANDTAAEVCLELGDLRDLHLEQRFDAVIAMFAVVGYQVQDEDLRGAVASVRRHLEPGGLMIFDCWYGPAVLAQGPSHRSKTIGDPADAAERLVRTADGRLDEGRNVCVVDLHLERVREGRVVSRTAEQHEMRYFFRQELEDLVASEGLGIVRFGAFPDIHRAPDERTWSVVVVARHPSGTADV
jgi:SAM-dependent methyltransferase